MAFQQGLSGLNNASKALDVISNNVANTGTVGFKQASSQFADIFATSLSGSGTAQIGIGSSVASVRQQFNQGNITTSNNPLDIAINGQGFFRMQSESGITYSRNGQFLVDKNGYIVNSAGLQLTGKTATAAGALTGVVGPLQLNVSDASPASTTESAFNLNLDSRATTPSALDKATVTGTAAPTYPVTITSGQTLNVTVDGASSAVSLAVTPGTYANSSTLLTAIQDAVDQSTLFGRVDVALDGTGNIIVTSTRSGDRSGIQLGGALATTFNLPTTAASGSNANFSISDPTSYTSSTSQTVYDSLGNPHTQTLYFVKTATDNRWDVYTSLDGGFPPEINPTTGTHTPWTVTFDPNGLIQSPVSASKSYTIATGATTPFAFDVDLTGTTQFGSSFGVNRISQDGFTTGKLSGLSVSAEGEIVGRFSNGQTRLMGQVQLVSFANPNGLQALGGNQWGGTADSGPEQPNDPGSGIVGSLQSGAVEDSNVDLTAELVNMITQQRAYQANAQSIKTQDQILQTLVNLR